MNSIRHPVPNLLARTTRRLGLFMAAVALLAIFPWVKSQTTFVGQWRVWTQDPVYEYREETTTPPDANNPNIYFEKHQRWIIPLGLSEPVLEDFWHVWNVIVPGVQGGIFNDNHWSTAPAWTAGLPDSNTEARIGTSRVIQLPDSNQSAATARSLTIFDADNDGQSVGLAGGTLNLTPLVFNDALRVGVASAFPAQSRNSTLTLDGATLTSTGFAKIGVGLPAGAGGALVGSMNLDNNSQWLHPAGLIEIGGGTGQGWLNVASGSLLAGSLLPGAATDPRIIIRPGSNFTAQATSIVRLSELLVNSGRWEAGYPPVSWGANISGTFDAGLLHLGESTQGTAYAYSSSNSKFGQVLIERSSWLELWGAAAADTIEVRDGVLYAANLTVGNTGSELGGSRIFDLAPATGNLATLIITGANNAVTVRGRAILGGYGAASVNITNGGVLDIRGSATLGASQMWNGGLFGQGTVSVSGAGSVFRAQNMEVGYTYDEYRWQPGESLPVGNLNVGSGGRVEIAGQAQTYGEVTYNYPGELRIGKGGTLDILDGTGKVVFADPSNGGTLHGNARFSSSGTIKGGGTGAGAHIDFGPRGGTLFNTGTIAPGHSAGWLSLNGDLSFQDPMSFSGDNGRLLIELGGTTAGLGYDVLEVLGDVDLTGGTVEFSFINGFAPVAGTTFYFLPVSGTLTGMFDSLVDHTGLGLTLADLSIAPGGGLQLIMPVSAIPEVGTIIPALAAVALAGWRLRRKWRR